MADAAATRNRLLAAVVALLAVLCVLVALLLVSPRPGAPSAAPVAPTSQGAAQTPAPTGSTITPTPAATTTAGGRQITFDSKGFGPLGNLARRQDGDPLALGRVDAPVVLVEYADYACPFCAVWATSTQKQLVDKYVAAGVLRIEWRDLVIFGEKSQRAALAARAAGRQGRYWPFHDALFAASPTSGHPDLTDDVLLGFARSAGVPDLARFRHDMDDAALAAAVAKDTNEARSFGASSTPTFSVNGVPVVGAEAAGMFTQIIESAAQVQRQIHGA